MNEDIVWVASKLVNVGPWQAIQFQEVNIAQLEQTLMEAQVALDEEAEEHKDECSWWQDWHSCNCGAFDSTSSSSP